MFLRNPIAGFVLWTALVYGALAAPWPGLQQAYSRAYRGTARIVFGSFGPDGIVEFVASPVPRGASDTQIIIRNRHRSAFTVSPHAPRRAGYLPTALLAALTMATPLPWTRRLKALAWGVAAVHLYVGLRLAVTLAHGFNGTSEWCLYELPRWWSSSLAAAYEMISISPTTPFLVAVFAWGLIGFRRGDWSRIFGREGKLHPRGKA
jgi:hypothetical protein